LCGVVIYRHLNISQKREVMKMIHATKDPKIIGVLTTKITDTLVSPHWGLWSQSKAELAEAKEYYQFISKYASYLGATASFASVKDIIKKSSGTKLLTGTNLLTVAVWIGLAWNDSILADVKAELESRKQFIKTKPY